MGYANLPQMFFGRAAELGDRARYRHYVDGTWREVGWTAMAARVRQIAAGLIDMGVAAGDRVALLSGTRAEWMEVDLAILASGALTIPIYPSVLAEECGYILANAGATVAFVENAAQREKVEATRREGFVLDGVPQRSPIRSVVTIDGAPGGDATLAGLLSRGAAVLDRHAGELDRRLAAMTRNTLATIVYTSGTTGPPKGVPQTHGNHLASVDATMRLGMLEEGGVDLFFLPLAHSFARMIEYVGIAAGSTTVFARSIDTLVDDLKVARPHVLPAVPRVYEKVYARVMAARDAGSAVKRSIFDAAVAIGTQRSACERAGKPVPRWLQAANAVAHRLVFHRIHETLGGNIRFLLSGGAPLSPDIAAFFHAAGILILEGYGLTETTPALTVNRPDRFKLGTVGLPLDCCEIRIAADGEILARGDNVVTGYYQRPEATAEAWDEEGWFHTGDIGEFDADGFLRITDRKKDLIKTSGGKYVAPQKVENLLKLQPHISQAVVIGDRRKYCVALITLDAPEVARWASGQGITLNGAEATAASEAVRTLIEGEVAAVNTHLASFESVKQFRILPNDFSTETGELTPSLKVKRKVVAERHGTLIEDMYR